MSIKRTLAFALALVMCFSLVTPGVAFADGCEGNEFDGTHAWRMVDADPLLDPDSENSIKIYIVCDYCTNDAELTATKSSTQHVPSTCKERGGMRYTYTASYDGVTFNKSYDYFNDPLDTNNHQSVNYDWNTASVAAVDGNYVATVDRVCADCGAKVESVTATVAAANETKAATCVEGGYKSATFQFGTESKNLTWDQDSATGVHTYVDGECSVCHAKQTFTVNFWGAEDVEEPSATVTVEYGDTVSAPSEIVLAEGQNWYLETDNNWVVYDFTTPVTSDLDIYVIQETGEGAGDPIQAEVAQIGTTTYASLEDAIAAAQSGDTITLLEDVSSDDALSIPYDKSLTLDLGDNTLSATLEVGCCDNNEGGYQGTFTVQNGTVSGAVDLYASHSASTSAVFNINCTVTDAVYLNGSNCGEECPTCGCTASYATLNINGRVKAIYNGIGFGSGESSDNVDVIVNVNAGSVVAGDVEITDYLAVPYPAILMPPITVRASTSKAARSPVP